MGGFGTWALGLHNPDRFATLTPICGGGDAVRAVHISHVPQWVHHGQLDNIVDVAHSEHMVEALKSAGSYVRFTKYPHLSHDCWTEAYNDVELWRWMLGIMKKGQGEVEVLPRDSKVSFI